MTRYKLVVGYIHHGSPHTAQYVITAPNALEAKAKARAEFEATHDPGTVIASMRCTWATGRTIKNQHSALVH